MPVNRMANNKNLCLKSFAENQPTDMPRIWAMNGALKIAPSQQNSTELKIQLTDSQGEAQTVILTKNVENQWIRSDRIQNSKPSGLSVDPKSGEVTIEKKFLLFGSKLIAHDTNGKITQVETNVLFQPVFSQATASFKYFENHLIKNPIATIAATDEDNKIKEYLFVHTNGAMSARSEDGKYAINTKGEIYLTVSGGGALISTNSKLSQVDSNDYETSTNQFDNYNIIAVDQTNLKSYAITVDFTVNNVLAIPHLYNNTNGVDSSGQNFSQDTNNQSYQFTSNNEDKVLVGYNENGSAVTGLGEGNIERGAVLSTLEGDDYVKLSQSVGSNNMDGGIALGNGNNTLLIGNDIIGGTNRSWVTSGDGNDTIIVGDFSSIFNDRDDIQNATILTGAGNDTLILQGGIVADKTIINMGEGDDIVSLTDTGIALKADQSLDGKETNTGLSEAGTLREDSIIILGAGNDKLNIDKDITSSIVIGGKVTSTGYLIDNKYQYDTETAPNLKDDGADNGIDIVTVGTTVTNSKIYLGGGNDEMTVGSYVDNSTINMGNGDDTVTIKGIVQSGTQINMGDGNNVLTTEGVNNASSITFGSGNDSLTIKSQLGVGAGNPTISMGAGDDIVTWGGTTISSTNPIDGGEGKDTLILTTITNTHTGSTNNPTNLGSSQFKGFEVIEMKNPGNSVDIRYSDLLRDTTNDGPLYIRGVAGSKVDLGQNNWNNDSVGSSNLNDGTGRWTKGSTTNVDGVSYDIYHHSTAGTDTSNDVYIQTGIIVI
ncbi:beta strand repeat-containing protein [Testudinibacter sp. P80/BLE/0925]|uniref:beta strand repeat-containing protein n=1 Tax=Testudinibacter sp. TW-1 TaxID=3417757 RepID=UPI003D36311B